MHLIHRPRRLRQTAAVRGLIRETQLHPADFIFPMFVAEGEGFVIPSSQCRDNTDSPLMSW